MIMHLKMHLLSYEERQESPVMIRQSVSEEHNSQQASSSCIGPQADNNNKVHRRTVIKVHKQYKEDVTNIVCFKSKDK